MNVIHIGLQRTGNTTLQNALFSRQNHFAYIGKRNDLFPNERVRDLITRISHQDSLEYDDALTQRLLRGICNESSPSKPVLIAAEIFSIEGRADRRLIAERLHRLFAPAKVLILLRAQTTIVQAIYLKHLSSLSGRILSFETWLERNYGGVAFADLHRVGLNYEPLVRAYEDIFGVDNVVILPSEIMHDDNSTFSTRLAELLHMPPAEVQQTLSRNVTDQRISRRHLMAHRLQDMFPIDVNLASLGRRLLPRSVYGPLRRFISGGGRLAAPPLSEHWHKQIAAQCAEGNSRLAARRGLPLRELGYPVVG
jgi:hypothetical protein